MKTKFPKKLVGITVKDATHYLKCTRNSSKPETYYMKCVPISITPSGRQKIVVFGNRDDFRKGVENKKRVRYASPSALVPIVPNSPKGENG